ncbi:MAG: DNA repair protein RecO [Clostridia bacterium]|nr:DNA repair protein RecO [Clostridia bacterium]
MIQKEVRGLVIRTTDVKESDRILTIFTAEMGVVSALATGARSLKSRKMSSTMQFCYSRFLLYKSGEYYRIREAELIESFFGIRNTLEGLALAGYVAEVLSDVTVAEAEEDLLRLSLNTLYAIAEGKHPTDRIKAAFEIRCASIIGFMPDVVACSECGERQGDFYFNIMGGSVMCRACNEKRARAHALPENPHESQIVCILSETAKVALSYCIYSPLEKLFSFTMPDEDMLLFSRATEEYLVNQLERTFTTLEFYNSVKPRK